MLFGILKNNRLITKIKAYREKKKQQKKEKEEYEFMLIQLFGYYTEIDDGFEP